MTIHNKPYEGRILRGVIIGAGVSGILMAYKLKKHLAGYVSFKIFEKSSDLGGTWHENTYPGCACDVPSHCYQYSFAPNPDWSRFYASSHEIKSYLQNVARQFDLMKSIRFNTKVTHSEWSEEASAWNVKTSHGTDVQCELLINAGGILNNPQMPAIKGVSSFAGPVLHTAAWDSSMDFSSKRIAVIGSGASAVQLVPELQTTAQELHVYIRTPSYICPPFALPTGDDPNRMYDEAEKKLYRDDSEFYLRTRKVFEQQFNGMYGGFIKDSPEQMSMRTRFTDRMRTIIQDESLRDRLIPTFEAGCRRINPGEAFLTALQQPNVKPIFEPIDYIQPEGVTAGGTHNAADVLVCATGFNTSFVPRFPIIGRNGVNLQDQWKDDPVSYMGLAVSGFPNYLIFLGPNTPISNGSLMGPIEATADYFVRITRKLIRQRVKSFDVRQDAQHDFDRHTQNQMKEMVWSGACSSWFKQGPNGKVTALWPGSGLQYMQVLAENRWEDFEWNYQGERYSYWQQGFSWIERPDLDPLGIEEREDLDESNVIPRKKSDLSFYLWPSKPLDADSPRLSSAESMSKQHEVSRLTEVENGEEHCVAAQTFMDRLCKAESSEVVTVVS